MQNLIALMAAVNEARARTGDKHIGTQAHSGLVDVVRAVPPESGKGRYTVTVLRADLTAAEAIDFLGSL